jgi:TP901 family phage tail tape measure protein
LTVGLDRTVTVKLSADIGQYVAGLRAAGQSTRDFGDRAVKQADKHRQAYDLLGKGLIVTGAAIGIGVAAAVRAYANFDKALSSVRAVSGATAGQMRALSGAALKAGADTKFSATEAATAEAELAKVGVSVTDILNGGLTGALDLAAAGNIDLGSAAMIAGQAMKIFKLSGKDIPAIADALAAGANKSAADVSDLAAALSQGGLVAKQTGLNITDTVGTLSAFADNALLGSDAGTSFKTMLQSLNPRSAEAKTLMAELGISAFDASGEFVGITQFAGNLQTALGKMSTEQRQAALQTIFGADAIRAATVLYDLGAQGLQKYITGVQDQGAAARIAAVQTDNLAGDFERLKGSIETGLIQAGSAGNQTLREMTQAATGAVNAFTGLPPGLQKGTFALAAVTSAAALAGGALLLLLPRVAATKAAMATLGVSTAKVAAGFKALTVAGAAVVAIDVLPDVFTKIDQAVGRVPESTDKLALSLLRLGKDGQATGELTKAFGKDFTGYSRRFELDAEGLGQAVDRLTKGNFLERDFPGLTSSAAESITELDKALASIASTGGIDQANTAFGNLTSSAGLTGEQITALQGLLPQYSDALAHADLTQTATSGSAKELSGGVAGVAKSAEEASAALDEMIQSLSDSGLIQLSTREAARAYQQAVDDATAAVKSNGKTMDINTQKGRDNQAALDGVASAAINKAKATYESTKATRGDGPAQEAFRASILRSREGLIRTAQSFGLSRAAAIRYADRVLAIPAVRRTTVTLSGVSSAISSAERLREQLLRIKDRSVTVTVRTNVANKIAANPRAFRATGGIIPPSLGSGPTADDVPINVSGGEYVIRARAVQRYGSALFDRLNAGQFAAGGLVGAAIASTTRAPQASPRQGPQVTFTGDLVALDVAELAARVERRIRESETLLPVA